ncbi:MAG: helix-turn-helix domain-containing protein [Defluviitaleaceae bacterium]|nr:helix-turn-helix domain-containing protein [Defluviitaleaceae bacterium]
MFNDRLRLTRIYRQKIQRELAELLKIDLRNYQKYEEGTTAPTLENLVLLADTLDTSVDFLLGRDKYLESLGVSIDIPLDVSPRRPKTHKVLK